MTTEMPTEMPTEMMSEIIEVQKPKRTIFDPINVEEILRKGYADNMNDMNLMIEVFDKLTALRRRYLIWYGGEWEQTLKETPTLTTDEYILGLLISIDNHYIIGYEIPCADILERMNKCDDNSKLIKVMRGV